jgi:dynein heavy chain
MCSLLDALLHPDVNPRLKDETEMFLKMVEKVFAFAFCWGLGGGLDAKSAYKFDNFITNEFDFDLPKGSIYDSFVGLTKVCGEFVNWDKMIPEFRYSKEVAYFDLVVPTKDTVRYAQLLRL